MLWVLYVGLICNSDDSVVMLVLYFLVYESDSRELYT